jgi:hypothetical protein
MTRRIPAIVVAVVGVVFIVLTFARNLFSVGPAFEEMIGDFRPALADEVIETYRADIQGLTAVAEEFQTAVAPGMAAQLGMSVEQFQQFVGEQFPAVATGVAALPELGPEFGGLIDLLDQQQENFVKADEIPTKDLSATTVPWMIFLIGLLAIGVGALMWTRGRLGAYAAVVLGVLVIVASFAMSLPDKSVGADDLNDALKPVYTPETIAQAGFGLQIVGAMGEQMQSEMLPALSQQLGLSAAELSGFLGQNFPATAQALTTMPDSMGRFQTLVNTFDANLDNYETLRPVAFSPIIWTLIVGSVVVLAMGVLLIVVKEEAVVDLQATRSEETVSV